MAMAINTVCEGLDDLALVRMDTTDQRADADDSRVNRGTEDIKKPIEWFLSNEPELKKIISAGSGIVGDKNLSCRNDWQIGIGSFIKMTG